MLVHHGQKTPQKAVQYLHETPCKAVKPESENTENSRVFTSMQMCTQQDMGDTGHELSSKKPDFQHVSKHAAAYSAAVEPAFSKKPDFTPVSDGQDKESLDNSGKADSIKPSAYTALLDADIDVIADSTPEAMLADIIRLWPLLPDDIQRHLHTKAMVQSAIPWLPD
jgi:hypothetical protein